MFKLEQSLIEKSLHANFDESQQAHFDKLMSELEVISGGLGFAELKAKAEAGSKEALQVMRDYIAKKEEIVEFIETKEMNISPENEFVEITELKNGDSVLILDGARQFQIGTICSSPDAFLGVNVKMDEEDVTRGYMITRLAKIAGPVGEKYTVVGEEEVDDKELLLELHEFEQYKVGDEFKSKVQNWKNRLIGFVLVHGKLKILGEFIDYDLDKAGKRKVGHWYIADFSRNFKKINTNAKE
ncbi:hypothetical protein HN858_02290 [Candidatus Falkowbacteria bacterium]|jgi:hypothetical protein|nr:hypothetical protein [Candidatus Falkowbacteria bacterium]MBT5503185.1 hypothetical protein [Candidatus Falkowbacteria bacterium]MBT6574573.1 hypothetical protein [Candidatus Falkowbacteria bacterium]MBT7348485.1 hypothetical protein [Candidatus Falkowbacteria bacterium]MBT7500850.1 hypothetical protein [Candidatus Falkowbacteria bacterium]